MVSLYHNSGAFGFGARADPQAVGWIGPEDPTLRAEAANIVQKIPQPHETNLARLLVRGWREHLPGPLWLMPMSHWAYELSFASRDWMPHLLRQIGIEPTLLEARNNAAAIEFEDREAPALERTALALLSNLTASDFVIAFPARLILCTLHHHKQLWWMTSDQLLVQRLRQLPVEL